MTNLERYRKKYLEYLPEDGIRWLLIAESPPKQKAGSVPSFFYYDEDDVMKVALLFKETMTALFDPNWNDMRWLEKANIAESRRELLKRFSKRGFYLLDALEQKPLGGKTREALSDRGTKRKLKNKLKELAVEGYLSNVTQTVILGTTVHEELFRFLKDGLSYKNGKIRLNIRNTKPVPLPYGHQWRRCEDFRECLRSLPRTGELVEHAIEDFCLGFLESPYLCYTEHGLHAMFYHRLMDALPNKRKYMRVDGREICTVQKEYKMGNKVGKSRKAHWDIAVLEENQSADRENWYDLLGLNSVVEFGLNAQEGHLEDDVKRLSHGESGVQNRFIVHLYRYSKSITKRDWQNEHEAFISPEEIDAKIREHGSRVVAYFALVDDTDGSKQGPWRIDGKSAPSLVS